MDDDHPQDADAAAREARLHRHDSTYDHAGPLPPGLTLALNKTGKPERVVPIDDAAEDAEEIDD